MYQSKYFNTKQSATTGTPVYPHANTAQDRFNPRYPEYCRYRTVMINQLVSCPTFTNWLNY